MVDSQVSFGYDLDPGTVRSVPEGLAMRRLVLVALPWVIVGSVLGCAAKDDPKRVTAAQVARALREGRAIVSTGPFVQVSVNDRGPGELVTVSKKRARVSVVASAPEWIDVRRAEIYVNGDKVATAGTSPGKGATRIDWQGEVPFKRDAWVVVIVRGDKLLDSVLAGTRAAPLAFTNPIFVDADGDGRFQATEERPARASTPAASGAVHPGLPSQ